MASFFYQSYIINISVWMTTSEHNEKMEVGLNKKCSVMSIMVSIKADLGIRLALMLAGQSFANRDCGIVELHQVILVLKLELKLL